MRTQKGRKVNQVKLCIALSEYDESGYFKRVIYPDVKNVEYVINVSEETEELRFISEGELVCIEDSLIEWYRIEEDDSPLVFSIENAVKNDEYEEISKVNDSPLLFF